MAGVYNDREKECILLTYYLGQQELLDFIALHCLTKDVVDSLGQTSFYAGYREHSKPVVGCCLCKEKENIFKDGWEYYQLMKDAENGMSEDISNVDIENAWIDILQLWCNADKRQSLLNDSAFGHDEAYKDVMRKHQVYFHSTMDKKDNGAHKLHCWSSLILSIQKGLKDCHSFFKKCSDASSQILGRQEISPPEDWEEETLAKYEATLRVAKCPKLVARYAQRCRSFGVEVTPAENPGMISLKYMICSKCLQSDTAGRSLSILELFSKLLKKCQQMRRRYLCGSKAPKKNSIFSFIQSPERNGGHRPQFENVLFGTPSIPPNDFEVKDECDPAGCVTTLTTFKISNGAIDNHEDCPTPQFHNELAVGRNDASHSSASVCIEKSEESQACTKFELNGDQSNHAVFGGSEASQNLEIDKNCATDHEFEVDSDLCIISVRGAATEPDHDEDAKQSKLFSESKANLIEMTQEHNYTSTTKSPRKSRRVPAASKKYSKDFICYDSEQFLHEDQLLLLGALRESKQLGTPNSSEPTRHFGTGSENTTPSRVGELIRFHEAMQPYLPSVHGDPSNNMEVDAPKIFTPHNVARGSLVCSPTRCREDGEFKVFEPSVVLGPDCAIPPDTVVGSPISKRKKLQERAPRGDQCIVDISDDTSSSSTGSQVILSPIKSTDDPLKTFHMSKSLKNQSENFEAKSAAWNLPRKLATLGEATNTNVVLSPINSLSTTSIASSHPISQPTTMQKFSQSDVHDLMKEYSNETGILTKDHCVINVPLKTCTVRSARQLWTGKYSVTIKNKLPRINPPSEEVSPTDLTKTNSLTLPNNGIMLPTMKSCDASDGAHASGINIARKSAKRTRSGIIKKIIQRLEDDINQEKFQSEKIKNTSKTSLKDAPVTASEMPSSSKSTVTCSAACVQLEMTSREAGKPSNSSLSVAVATFMAKHATSVDCRIRSYIVKIDEEGKFDKMFEPNYLLTTDAADCHGYRYFRYKKCICSRIPEEIQPTSQAKAMATWVPESLTACSQKHLLHDKECRDIVEVKKKDNTTLPIRYCDAPLMKSLISTLQPFDGLFSQEVDSESFQNPSGIKCLDTLVPLSPPVCQELDAIDNLELTPSETVMDLCEYSDITCSTSRPTFLSVSTCPSTTPSPVFTSSNQQIKRAEQTTALDRLSRVRMALDEQTATEEMQDTAATASKPHLFATAHYPSFDHPKFVVLSPHSLLYSKYPDIFNRLLSLRESSQKARTLYKAPLMKHGSDLNRNDNSAKNTAVIKYLSTPTIFPSVENSVSESSKTVDRQSTKLRKVNVKGLEDCSSSQIAESFSDGGSSGTCHFLKLLSKEDVVLSLSTLVSMNDSAHTVIENICENEIVSGHLVTRKNGIKDVPESRLFTSSINLNAPSPPKLDAVKRSSVTGNSCVFEDNSLRTSHCANAFLRPTTSNRVQSCKTRTVLATNCKPNTHRGDALTPSLPTSRMRASRKETSVNLKGSSRFEPNAGRERTAAKERAMSAPDGHASEQDNLQTSLDTSAALKPSTQSLGQHAHEPQLDTAATSIPQAFCHNAHTSSSPTLCEGASDLTKDFGDMLDNYEGKKYSPNMSNENTGKRLIQSHSEIYKGIADMHKTHGDLKNLENQDYLGEQISQGLSRLLSPRIDKLSSIPNSSLKTEYFQTVDDKFEAAHLQHYFKLRKTRWHGRKLRSSRHQHYEEIKKKRMFAKLTKILMTDFNMSWNSGRRKASNNKVGKSRLNLFPENLNSSKTDSFWWDDFKFDDDEPISNDVQVAQQFSASGSGTFAECERSRSPVLNGRNVIHQRRLKHTSSQTASCPTTVLVSGQLKKSQASMVTMVPIRPSPVMPEDIVEKSGWDSTSNVVEQIIYDKSAKTNEACCSNASKATPLLEGQIMEQGFAASKSERAKLSTLLTRSGKECIITRVWRQDNAHSSEKLHDKLSNSQEPPRFLVSIQSTTPGSQRPAHSKLFPPNTSSQNALQRLAIPKKSDFSVAEELTTPPQRDNAVGKDECKVKMKRFSPNLNGGFVSVGRCVLRSARRTRNGGKLLQSNNGQELNSAS